VASEKVGKSVIYQLKLSVLEDALLGFAQAFGMSVRSDTSDPTPSNDKEVSDP